MTVARNSRQRGASMLLALVALLIISLTAVALVRSVDTGTLIIGNIGFKQDATEVSSIAAERAMVWLETHISDGTLDADQVASGYYASSLDRLDPTGSNTSAANKLPLVNWDGNCQNAPANTYTTCSTVPFTSNDINGNRVQWVITRLCDTADPPSATNLCVRPVSASTSSASDRGDLSAAGRISAAVSSPYYRIIVRTSGPRNTVSYTETLMHF